VVYGVTKIALPGSDLTCCDLHDPLRAKVPLTSEFSSFAESPTFVAGPENRLAVPALEQLLAGDDLDTAATLFNPLVMLGPTGTGKSQLARGITRRWQSLLKKQKATTQITRTVATHAVAEYLTTADFARQLHTAREANTVDAFRQRLANLRLLVLEDLQRLSPRVYVQRELRDTLDVLIEAGAVVVITAAQPPATMSGLDAGLRDRLASGLTIRLQPPGPEARIELLQQIATERGLQISTEQLHVLAQKATGPAPQLFRALSEYELAAGEISPLAQARGPLQFKQILAIVARYYSLTQAAIRSSARRKSLVQARAVTIYLARTLTTQTYTQIGHSLGGRDHTTVMHAARTFKKRLTSDASAQQDIEELKRILTAV